MRTRAIEARRRAGLLARAFLPLAALLATPIELRAGDGVPPAGTAENEPKAALAAALGAVKADFISADIHFIASDQMRGRYTPSPELQIVARYLRARLQRLGFEPGAAGGFLYEYDLTHNAIDAQRSLVKVTGETASETFTFGDGFFYSRGNLGEDGDTSAAVVFCGFGTEDDLKDAQLEGAWALLLDDGERRGSFRELRNTGAVGALVVPAAEYTGEPYAERFAESTKRMIDGVYAYEPPGAEGRRVPRFSQVHLSSAAGAKLMAAAGLAPGAVPALRARLPIMVTEERRVLGGDDAKVTVENVCGLWRGSDPVLSKEVLIVSAHYDHIGMRGEEVCNGADDNGSGTTGLLAVAEALAAHGPFRRSVLLIWVSGEERGLWGSAAWADEPALPEGLRPVANLNIDMIGRNAPGELYITPSVEHELHNGIVRMAQSLAPLEGFPELGNADKFYGRSDQANFALLEIPVAFLFSGLHDDYHEPTDDPDKIDCDKIRRVARLVVRLIDSLQSDALGV